MNLPIGDLPPELRELLDAEADFPPVDADRAARIIEGVEARVVAPRSGGGTPSGVPAAGRGISVAALAATGLAGFTLGVLTHAMVDRARAPETIEAAVATHASSGTTPADAPSAPPGPAPPASDAIDRGPSIAPATPTPSVPPPEPTPFAARPRARRAVVSPPTPIEEAVGEPPSAPPGASTTEPAGPPAAPSPPSPADALAAERALIDVARTAVARHHPDVALDAIQRHERDFPHGQLTEEREGLRVIALARAGERDEARARAEQFRARWPRSVLLRAIDAVLTPE